MQDYILQFLRSPTWRAHTIHSAEEAYIDLLACPEDERPKNYTALGKRWHVSRQFAKRICDKLQALGLIKMTDEGVILNNTGVIESNTQSVIENNTVTENNTPPSRDIQDNNISNILPPQPPCACVREEDVVEAEIIEAEPIPTDESSSNTSAEINIKPPSPDEVQAYINQIGGAQFSGQYFVDHYIARSQWNSRNIRPRVWQAMVRTWRERDKQRTINSPSTPHNNAQSPTINFHPSTREAERQQRDHEFAQHIMQQLATPEQPDSLPF